MSCVINEYVTSYNSDAISVYRQHTVIAHFGTFKFQCDYTQYTAPARLTFLRYANFDYVSSPAGL